MRPRDLPEQGSFLTIGETARRLRLSVKQVRLLADKGDLPSERRGQRRVFPRAAVESRAAQQGAGDGPADAKALKLMMAAKSDAEVVIELEMPLHHVQTLRSALRAATDPDGARDDEERQHREAEWQAFRERLHARRRAVQQKF